MVEIFNYICSLCQVLSAAQYITVVECLDVSEEYQTTQFANLMLIVFPSWCADLGSAHDQAAHVDYRCTVEIQR